MKGSDGNCGATPRVRHWMQRTSTGCNIRYSGTFHGDVSDVEYHASFNPSLSLGNSSCLWVPQPAGSHREACAVEIDGCGEEDRYSID